MRDKYLGDTYDIVKRFWADSLRVIAPLYAHPRFVAAGLQSRFSLLTSMPILSSRPEGRLGIFFDPHTGIPLPEESVTKPTASHAPLPYLAQANEELRPAYMICFDQSHYRNHELNTKEQRCLKMTFLAERGIGSFYYLSHAPFLFMAQEAEILVEIRDRLISLGIPRSRFELFEGQ